MIERKPTIKEFDGVNSDKLVNNKNYLKKIKSDNKLLINFFRQGLEELGTSLNYRNPTVKGTEIFLGDYYISTVPFYQRVKLYIIKKSEMKQEARKFLTWRYEHPKDEDFYFTDWLAKNIKKWKKV